MANMNVKKRLEKLSNELDQLVTHVVQYSGIDKKEAMLIDTMATSLAAQAARLASEARAAQGQPAAHLLVTRVRRALGFYS